MAHQPLGALPLVAAACALMATSCRNDEPYDGLFDNPIAIGVLQPEQDRGNGVVLDARPGPFDEPIAFVANAHGGRIVPLAVKQGRFLTDDPTASFLRTNMLPTGGLRLLTSVAAYAPSERQVTVYAGDRAFGRLLRVPYLVDCEVDEPDAACATAVADEPVEPDVSWEPLSQAPSATVGRVQLKRGYTATETWTGTWDGETWRVEGSRSGLQPERVGMGARFTAAERRISFVVEGSAEVGDEFTVKTRSGLVELEVGGAPDALSMAPDQSWLAMIVQDEALQRPVVRWFDPATEALGPDVALPAGSLPARLTWTEDGQLLVADAALPAVWEVAPGAEAVVEHPLPWPALDVASLDGPERRTLFVVPLDGRGVWRTDRDTGEMLDVNPLVDGVQGMEFTVAVRGIGALRRPHLTPEFTDDGVRVVGRTVAISLSDGRTVFAHEDTGCLVQDNLGPRTEPRTTQDYDTNFQRSVAGGAVLETNGASSRHVVVSACAGIAKAENWQLRFDQVAQAWVARGSFSGEQANLVREDERYVSDEGAFSLTVLSGATPSQDGWTIDFGVASGVATASGDTDGDGVRETVLGVGGDPVYVEYRVGTPTSIDEPPEGDAPWIPLDVRPLVLIPGETTDVVTRVDPQEANFDLGWN